MVWFNRLRATPWNPTFTWVDTAAKAADQINSFHEDYPQRIEVTRLCIEMLANDPDRLTSTIFNPTLWFIHQSVFKDCSFAGQWRSVVVRVGLHAPPLPERVPDLMDSLFHVYQGRLYDLGMLQDWYTDFETIHPFQDGNGRVGGIIVAAYSHLLHPEKGWLAVNQ